jgi:S1-C subfamily serine protease
MPAVMTINVYRRGQLQAQGSGFFIDTNGSAITNVHVLRDGDSAQVLLADGRKFPITSVVAFDEARDLTLYKVGTGNQSFPKVTLGSSNDVNVGERVLVIGSPEGLNNTVSEGILSARRPKTSDEQALLQVSAAISPGSSGGPVFDKAGGVVGVAQSTLEEGQNLNFAIPVEAVIDLIHAPAMNLTPAAFYRHMVGRPDPEETSSDGEETDPEPPPSKAPPSTPPPAPSSPSGHDVTASFSSNGNGK